MEKQLIERGEYHSSDKPILYFVPHYLGSLRYYEKLLPYLKQKYEVRFLLTFTRGYFEDMRSYCIERQLDYKAFLAPNHDSFFIHKLLWYKRQVKELLLENRIKKIIAFNDAGFYADYLFAEVQKLGIDAAVLQWSYTYPKHTVALPKKSKSLARRILYKLFKPFYILLRQALVFIILGVKSNFFKTGIGSGRAKRFGVINEQAVNYFMNRGIPREKMTIVGYLDFVFADEAKAKLDTDENYRFETAKRIGIDTTKKRIAFYSSPYNKKEATMLNDSEQYKYTRKIVEIIRSVCPEADYQILFKIHPSESLDLYKPLEKYGVTLFDRTANNYELIYFADLYIADNTVTNFIAERMQKDAIFINFLKLKMIELAREFFSIRKFVTDYEEFKKFLGTWKEDRLEKQYVYDETIFTEDSMTKILNWIG